LEKFNPLALIGITQALFAPISMLIERVIPDFLEKDLKSEAVRRAIVDAVDKALVAQQPGAAVIPAETRKRIIRTLVNLALDEILLASV
jgi:hypothetical protein